MTFQSTCRVSPEADTARWGPGLHQGLSGQLAWANPELSVSHLLGRSWGPGFHPLLCSHGERLAWQGACPASRPQSQASRNGAEPRFSLLQKAPRLSGSFRLCQACEGLNPVASESLIQVRGPNGAIRGFQGHLEEARGLVKPQMSGVSVILGCPPIGCTPVSNLPDVRASLSLRYDRIRRSRWRRDVWGKFRNCL